MKSLKTVLVCFYEAYPAASGSASVTYNIAKYLQGETVLIQLGRQKSHECTEDGLRLITLVSASDNRLQKLRGLFGLIKEIAEIIKSTSPDTIILEGGSWVLYHWLLFRQLRRQRSDAKIVYHAHNVEYYLRKEKHGRIVTWVTRWAEGRLLKEADLSFAVSSIDSAQFAKLYKVSPELLPNGVDYRRFNKIMEKEISAVKSEYGLEDNVVFFMGFYLYKPNREAIDFLVEEVMPKVILRCPNAKLVIIGSKVPYSNPWLINPGSVPYEHVPAICRSCRIGVAPIFSGSGTRLKILEYMAAGKPVISTTKGAEGLNVIEGTNILLADNADDFADAVIRLLTDQDLAASIGEGGRDMVNINYSWEVIMEDFNKRLSALK